MGLICGRATRCAHGTAPCGSLHGATPAAFGAGGSKITVLDPRDSISASKLGKVAEHSGCADRFGGRMCYTRRRQVFSVGAAPESWPGNPGNPGNAGNPGPGNPGNPGGTGF